MRILCDVCEATAARVFCAADEAALCVNCDEKVHGCNKLANRHVRLELTESRAVPRCDICEKASAFFFCVVDGTSLCLQCDMDVHVGGKQRHERYLMMGQRVELPFRTQRYEEAMEVNKQQREQKNATKDKREDVLADKTGRPSSEPSWGQNKCNASAIAVGESDEESLLLDGCLQQSRMIDLNIVTMYTSDGYGEQRSQQPQ